VLEELSRSPSTDWSGDVAAWEMRGTSEVMDVGRTCVVIIIAYDKRVFFVFREMR